MASSRQILVNVIQKATRALPRRLTASLGGLPDFLIIGATKAGTTSLYEYLVQHPLVAPARHKEVHFFDERFERGEYWYRSFFPLLHVQKLERGILAGEATTRYLTNARAPELARSLMPAAKLIVLLRNPVDRAYSHHQMVHRMGLRDIHSDFSSYVRQSRSFWPSGNSFQQLDFPPRDAISECVTWIQFGLYAEHLAAWLQHFPREQMLILNSESFFAHPQQALDRVTRFLGLRDHAWPVFPVFNGGSYGSMPPSIREELVDYYRPHNERLFRLLGERYAWDG
jgi:hypothetical protein